MESVEQRSSKKKLSAIIGVVLILAGGAWFAYTQGLIPGFGAGTKVANELKAEIEALKGQNLKAKISDTYGRYAQGTPEEIAEYKQIIDSLQIDFQYTGLEAKAEDGKGTVDVITPKLSITSPKDNMPGEIAASKLVVSRDVNDANHYFFHTEGDLEFYGAIGGTKTKIFSISADEPQNEIKYGEKPRDGYFKSSAKNIKFVEGRGNTVVATIAESSIESNQTTGDNGDVDAAFKASYKNIVPGDMIKLMIGDIQPISFNFDYAYKGNDVNSQLRALMEKKADKIAPFDGDVKVNDFSLMMGDAGVSANADLKFAKSNAETIPTGSAVLKITQYQKLIDYAGRFMPIPADQTENTIKFLSEIGKNDNGSITFNLTFDGTKNVLIDGKNQDEIKAIHEKYFPPMPVVEGLDGAMATPPVVVESKPISPNAPADINASNSPDAPPPATTPAAPAKTETLKTETKKAK